MPPMPTFPVEPGFHHVALRVRDFDKSLALYAQHFGFTPRIAWGEAPKRAVIMAMGNGAHLELFERPEQPPPEQEGTILHICVPSRDVDACAAAAKSLGLKVTMEPKDVAIANSVTGKPAPVRICFIEGYDGESIEFFDEK